MCERRAGAARLRSAQAAEVARETGEKRGCAGVVDEETGDAEFAACGVQRRGARGGERSNQAVTVAAGACTGAEMLPEVLRSSVLRARGGDERESVRAGAKGECVFGDAGVVVVVERGAVGEECA